MKFRLRVNESGVARMQRVHMQRGRKQPAEAAVLGSFDLTDPESVDALIEAIEAQIRMFRSEHSSVYNA